MGNRRRALRAAKWTGGILLAGLALLAAVDKLFEPGERGLAALKSDRQVSVAIYRNWIEVQPAGKAAEPSVIFYPGAFADPRVYGEFGRRLAAAGHRVYLVRMPLHLSVLGRDRALGIIAARPGESFVIGGHSLGGAVAARFASAHPDKVKGVYLLASFAEKTSHLRSGRLPVLHITATNDGIVHANVWRRNKDNLPDGTVHVAVKGGNHVQFGSYRRFPPDAPASVTEGQQLEAVANAMQVWLGGLKRGASPEKSGLTPLRSSGGG